MQLLPRGMQELPRPQRKTASEQLIDQQELLPMRLARARAEIRRRVVWSIALTRSWEGPRPIHPSPETPDGYRNRDPRKGHYENIRPKTPLRQQTKEKSSEQR
jgi:hypothetical protein